MVGYSDGHVGSDIQDFKVKNAINKIADSLSNVAQLVSAGVTPAANFTFAAAYGSATSLATDLLTLLNALKTAGIVRQN